jgi:formyl-CoA transferase
MGGFIEEHYQPFWLLAFRNKLPITLNLKHAQGQRIFAELLRQADVLLENMRAGTLERLMDLVGHPELKDTPGYRNNQERLRPESRTVLNGIIADWIKGRPLGKVLEACEKAGVAIGPVYEMADIAHDQHVEARGTLVPVLDPASGTSMPLPQPAIRMSATPGGVRFPGLPMGAANEVVLGDLLGYTSDQIVGLKSSGAI